MLEFTASGSPKTIAAALEQCAVAQGNVSALVVPWESDRQTLSIAVRRANLSIPSVYTSHFGAVLYMQVSGFDSGTGDAARILRRSGQRRLICPGNRKIAVHEFVEQHPARTHFVLSCAVIGHEKAYVGIQQQV